MTPTLGEPYPYGDFAIELSFTGNVRRLRLRHGDVVVIEGGADFTQAQAAEVNSQMKTLFPDNGCLILAGELTMRGVLRPDQGAE